MSFRNKCMINFTEFRNKLHTFGCFSIYQGRTLFPLLDRNSLVRWTKRRLLIRLRQGWYTFPDMLSKPDFSRYVAGRIYAPSYVSLHTALSFYGVIPESVTQITSVTTLKTAFFENALGQYTYKTVKPQLFWGYKPVEMPSADGGPSQVWHLAHPEKALLDILYLYPFYNNEDELLQLRLDEDFMAEELNRERLREYLLRFNSKALNDRVKKLLKIYTL